MELNRKEKIEYLKSKYDYFCDLGKNLEFLKEVNIWEIQCDIRKRLNEGLKGVYSKEECSIYLDVRRKNQTDYSSCSSFSNIKDLLFSKIENIKMQIKEEIHRMSSLDIDDELGI